MKASSERVAAWIAIAVLSYLVPVFALTSPETFLGHRVGADRRLAGYEQIHEYLLKLDGESGRVQYLTIGTSTLGKPIGMAVVSSEANMAALEGHRATVRRLADPRGVSAGEMEALVDGGKVFLLILCNQHSNEIASSNMALELVWSLARGDDPEMERALRDVVVMIVPTANPDGQEMIVDFYDKYLGTPYEGGQMPWLYHHYAGHDNNRDWFVLNLAENDALVDVLYGDWHPQVLVDVHQMGANGPRMFVPPFFDPPNPNNPKVIWSQIEILGSYMKYRLAADGKSGVINNAYYSGWYQGSIRPNATQHNITALLTENASVRIATPVYIEPSELRGTSQGLPEYGVKMNFTDPWPGGWWRLRDIVDYQLVAMKGMIVACERNRDQFLRNFHGMAAEALRLTEDGAPYAYIIPADQRDPGATARLLKIFDRTRCEIHRARSEFRYGDRVFPEGSLVLMVAQPFGRFVKDLLEVKPYPDMREYPGGPPMPPYDNAAWTLGLMMGVDVVEASRPFDADLVLLDSAPIAPSFALGGAALLDCRDNNAYHAVNVLLDGKARVRRYTERFNAGGREWPAGTFLVDAPEKLLRRAADSCRVTFVPVSAAPAGERHALKLGRVGVYRGWVPSADEGWTRLVLDRFAFNHERLTNERAQKGGLIQDFDVIVLPSLGKQDMIDGPGSGSRNPGLRNTPPEYSGGLGKSGVKALEQFVKDGGVLIALRGACSLPIEEFRIPVREGSAKTSEGDFFCPGSLLGITVDNGHPLGFGMPEDAAAFYSGGKLLETFIPPAVDTDRRVVVSYTREDVLLSGWVVGEKAILGKPAVVDVSLGKGRVVLFGFGAQNRAQTWGTFKLLFNAILCGYGT